MSTTVTSLLSRDVHNGENSDEQAHIQGVGEGCAQR